MGARQTKECLLCTKRIPVFHHTCKSCYPTYLEYQNADWIKELKAMRERQMKIDVQEGFPIFDSVEHTSIIGVEMPYTHRLILEHFINLGLSVPQICKKYDMNKSTVYNILRRNGLSADSRKRSIKDSVN